MHNQFKQFGQINGNRAVGMQISMIHIKSGIRCSILFQNNNEIIESVKIIKRFTDDPLCKFELIHLHKKFPFSFA